jgi:hypothetical protein
MYTTINGWTRERMIAQIYKYNNGKRAGFNESDPESTDYRFVCTYRNPADGNRCAVGCFLEDEDSLILDAKDCVSDLLDIYPSLSSCMPLDDIGMSMFQGVHDRCSDGGDVRIALRDWIKKNVVDAA